MEQTPQPPDRDEAARWSHFGETVTDLVAARTADELDAAIASMQQAAKGLDSKAWLNALHVPEDAGEYEQALERILRRIPDGWGRWISCDKGWYPLLARLDEQLAELLPDYEIHQVKEKFATLRFYWSCEQGEMDEAEFERRMQAAHELVGSAEAATAHMCEICGARGEVRRGKSAGGWLKTVCDEHAKVEGRDELLTNEQWKAWWAEEEPRFRARQKEAETKRWHGKRTLMVGHSERELGFEVEQVTDPARARELAGVDWDGVWIGSGPAAQAFVDAYAERHQDLIDKIKTEREAAFAARKGFTYPKPEGWAYTHRMPDSDADTKVYREELGMYTGVAPESQLAD
jgi:hypothetical protein